MVVEFGRGLSVDIVGEDVRYNGGVIAPGINLRVEASNVDAAKLPRIAIERPAHVIGKSTVEAMKSGVYWGYSGLIEGLITRIRAEHGRNDMKVLVTGGLAPLFADATDVFDAVDPDLTMKGLLIIHQRNSASETA